MHCCCRGAVLSMVRRTHPIFCKHIPPVRVALPIVSVKTQARLPTHTRTQAQREREREREGERERASLSLTHPYPLTHTHTHTHTQRERERERERERNVQVTVKDPLCKLSRKSAVWTHRRILHISSVSIPAAVTPRWSGVISQFRAWNC